MSTEARYRIFETLQFQKDLRQIAKAGHQEVAGKLQRIAYPQLRESPHFGPNVSKLKGYAPPTWRYRSGAWRFFYEIDEAAAIVLMIAAFHRGSAY